MANIYLTTTSPTPPLTITPFMSDPPEYPPHGVRGTIELVEDPDSVKDEFVALTTKELYIFLCIVIPTLARAADGINSPLMNERIYCPARVPNRQIRAALMLYADFKGASLIVPIDRVADYNDSNFIDKRP